MATDGVSRTLAEGDQVCVFLWALPRSISTAMTKCMSYVEGVQVWHEPYLYSYHNEKSRDPLVRERLQPIISASKKRLSPILAKTERGKRIDNDLFEFSWVKSQLESQDLLKKLVFVKDMAHVMNGKYGHLPTSRKFRHTFLIRDPSRMYPSFFKMAEEERIRKGPEDTALSRLDTQYDTDKIYKYTYDLWRHTKQHHDPDAVIIDGTDLAAQPEKILPKFFAAIGIPYKEDYLSWDSSPDVITEWKASFGSLVGAYTTNIIKRAVDSSHFIPEGPPPSRDSLSADVIRCIDAAQPYYDSMYEHRIRP